MIASLFLICLGISCWFDRRHEIDCGPPVRRGALRDLLD